MLIDGRRVDPDSGLDADLCILGSGAAGIAMARNLSGSGLDVLLVESGGMEPDEKTQELNAGEIVGLPLDPDDPLPLRDTHLRYFGGTTNHWGGFCRRFQPIDFEPRSWVPHSGWPIRLTDVEPYYRGAEELIGLDDQPWNAEYWARQPGFGDPLLVGEPVTSVVARARPARFNTLWRDAIVTAPNVRLCTWTNAVEVVVSDDGAHVDHIECRTLSGNQFTVRARAYVVALGAIEGARLLLASNGVQRDGLGNASGLLGRCFMEHLLFLSGPVIFTAPPASFSFYGLHEYPETAPIGPNNVHGEMLLSDEGVRREQLRGLVIQFWPFNPTSDAKRVTPLVGPRAVGELSGAIDGVPGQFTIPYVTGEQSPNPRSGIRLLREKDAVGMPKVALDWRVVPEDYESMVQGLGVVASELGARALGRWQLATQLGGNAVEPLLPSGLHTLDHVSDSFPVSTGFHHMGTMRMSASPNDGVVDADCRVHSVGNLYVAGSGVFTTSSVSPPTLTLIALALRLADHLRTRVLV